MSNIVATTSKGTSVIVDNYIYKSEVKKTLQWWKENGMSNVTYSAFSIPKSEQLKGDWSLPI